ncbi:MAG: phosphatidylserine decarboxylase [Bacteroidota bacterium]
MDTLRKSILVPIHRAGWPFIAVFAVTSLLLSALAWPLGVLGLLATAWCAWFFRDPDRLTPTRHGLVISPADGVVSGVTTALPPDGLGLPERPLARVSVFLDVLDVHINRAPINGTIIGIRYRPGKFVNASLDKASEHNERNALRIVTADGTSIVVVQIAGLIARRIRTWVREGQAVRAGERFGMIRFGSRVDVYLPEGVAPLVAPGQRCIGGETVIADLRAQEAARQAERR